MQIIVPIHNTLDYPKYIPTVKQINDQKKQYKFYKYNANNAL